MKRLITVFISFLLSVPVYAESLVPIDKLKSVTSGVPYNQPFSVDVNFRETVLRFKLSSIEGTNGTPVALTDGLLSNYTLQIMPTVTSGSSKILTIIALNPKLRPSSNFNLSRFQLNLPLPLNGGHTALEVESGPLNGNPTKNTGYTKSPYFYTDPETGSMNFFAPLNGATTPGSDYPRSELQEEEFLNWTLDTFANSTMTASLLINMVPPSKRIITIAQIHQGDSKIPGTQINANSTGTTVPLLKVYYDANPSYHSQKCNGCIRAQIRPTPLTGSTKQTDIIIATNIPLNKIFTYTVSLSKNGLLTVAAEEKKITYQLNTSTDASKGWGKQGLYFKAGVYLQENGSSSTQGGKAKFYYFNMIHTPI